jgi:hypothetical protein
MIYDEIAENKRNMDFLMKQMYTENAIVDKNR